MLDQAKGDEDKVGGILNHRNGHMQCSLLDCYWLLPPIALATRAPPHPYIVLGCPHQFLPLDGQAEGIKGRIVGLAVQLLRLHYHPITTASQGSKGREGGGVGKRGGEGEGAKSHTTSNKATPPFCTGNPLENQRNGGRLFGLCGERWRGAGDQR